MLIHNCSLLFELSTSILFPPIIYFLKPFFISSSLPLYIFCSNPLFWTPWVSCVTSFWISCFTCTLHSQPPPGRSVRQTPGVCGSLAVTAVSMTTAGCEGKRWGSVGCGWLHPLVLPWCFRLCGTSLWWGDCCLLVVTTDQLLRPVIL